MQKKKVKEQIKAKIEEAKIYDIYDLLKHKPRGLGFEDTDAIVVTVKTQDGKKITETFYVCIKPDGTFATNPISSHSRFRRETLNRFLKHYKITEEVKDYKVVEEIEKWKGMEVEVVPYKDGGYIFIP
ncbi:MAG: hypothetical protein PQ975_07290 [Methanobacterium sp.]